MSNSTDSGGAGDAPTGLVLAAGAGRRFGMPKAYAEGGRWLTAAVDALRDGGCGTVLVALDAVSGGRALVPGVETVPVLDSTAGLSRSVAAGLHRCRGEVVLMLVDTPDVNGECVRRVIDAGRRSASGTARAVYREQAGHPVYIAAQQRLSMIERLHAGGVQNRDRGLRPYLGADVATVECGDVATGQDIDTPDQLARFRAVP